MGAGTPAAVLFVQIAPLEPLYTRKLRDDRGPRPERRTLERPGKATGTTNAAKSGK